MALNVGVSRAAGGSLPRIPLYFIENRGQLDPQIAYYIQGQHLSVYFTSHGVVFVLSSFMGTSPAPDKLIHMASYTPRPNSLALGSNHRLHRWVVKLDFVGANAEVRPLGRSLRLTKINYFKGKPAQWQVGINTYGSLVYPDLWPGIDLIYTGGVNRLKYRFVVKSGADPSQIRLAYSGAQLTLSDEGHLLVATGIGSLADDVPFAYQEQGNRRHKVDCSYELEQGRTNGPLVYGFHLGNYDRSRTLVLDPALVAYCGYIGGSAGEEGRDIAVDAKGNAYITGWTVSDQTSLPVKTGPDTTQNGDIDALVAKVKADGTDLLYCGYIGGDSWDYGEGIEVDSDGNAYVVGYTGSKESTFPVLGGPDTTHNGGVGSNDAFVAKVKADGSGLVYCGYIGGSEDDLAYDVAVDSAGNAYIAGYTWSNEISDNFPLSVGPDTTYNGKGDAFVAKVKADGTGLAYCGYIGGEDGEEAYGIAVDGNGNAYLTGYTSSTQSSFPVKTGPDTTHNGYTDAFVAKVKADGTGLAYCGYIGGEASEFGYGIAVDGNGNAYITGRTDSGADIENFPAVVGPDTTFNFLTDAFVAKVKADGSGFEYCGYIGGWDQDCGTDIAIDEKGCAYVAGYTSSDVVSEHFPVKVGPDGSYNGGDHDAFVAKVKADGTGLEYCGYIGGHADERATGIAVDQRGNAYLTGWTYSGESTFPVQTGPSTVYNGSAKDAFVVKICQHSSATALPAIELLLDDK
ncbi:MAG: SBBP repeat-containing protein [Deltaproteobacteria bacterium]|nr:SBBP repeat-containing protein [Deltaproteobacteria bacterium]